jgi:hypothetical protein
MGDSHEVPSEAGMADGGRRPTTAPLTAHVLHAHEKASLAAPSRLSRAGRAAVTLCPVATDPSQPAPLKRRSRAELTVRDAHGDLLEVQPPDLGPGTPATLALEHERGPQPHNAIKRGDQ